MVLLGLEIGSGLPPSNLCLAADVKIVTDKPGTAADERAGSDVAANRTGNNCTAKRTNAATLKIVVKTGRKGGRTKQLERTTWLRDVPC